MTEPRLEASVVIPSWNGAEFVEKTLDLLVKTEGVAFEVLVVDHGRLNRRTEEVMRKFNPFPWVRYIGEDEQLGFAGAVNHGVRLAKSDFVAVICNDVLVDAQWLKELVRACRAEKEKGKSPVLFSLVDRGFLKDLRTVRTNFWFRGLLHQEVPPREDFFFPDGSAFLFDKSVYGEPFDSGYFLYQEDVYFGWRARLGGAEVRMVPASRADNFDGGTTKRTPYRTSYYSERNRWLNYFYFLSFPNLLRALPLLWADMLVKLLVGTNRRAKFHAWFWIAFHLPEIYRKRKRLQASRRRGDAEILSLLSSTYIDKHPSHPVNRIVRAAVKILGLPLGS